MSFADPCGRHTIARQGWSPCFAKQGQDIIPGFTKCLCDSTKSLLMSAPPVSAMSYMSAMKKVPSGGAATITKRIEDLDKESDLFQAEIEGVKTRHAALQYNYAICDKELDVRKKELNFECSNAELAFL